MGPPSPQSTESSKCDVSTCGVTDKAAPDKRGPSLSSKKNGKKDTTSTATTTSLSVGGKDKGHRYGNFHNYYTFNPTQERMQLLQKSGGILEYIATHWNEAGKDDAQARTPADTISSEHHSRPVKKKPRIEVEPRISHVSYNYLDVGCNEGDLTMEVAKDLARRLATGRKVKKDDDKALLNINAKGVDIDQALIHRANRKYMLESPPHANNKNTSAATTPKTPAHLISPSFKVSNVLSPDFERTMRKEQRFDLISLFSTTMWVHIHGGDEGLRRALGHICRRTKSFLLIEPQPSKCYRSAMVRLRKMGLPEFDVSFERLTLRPKLEEALDGILIQHSFRRVVDFAPISSSSSSSSSSSVEHDTANDKEEGDKTRWNRSIWLYQRCSPTTPPT